MRPFLSLLVVASLATAAPLSVASAQTAPAAYEAALASPIRTTEDRARDVARHAAETLAFARVGPGQKIGDMIMGGGYFTRLFSAAVGPEGQVVAWQPAEFIGFQASYAEALAAAAALDNVEALSGAIGDPASLEAGLASDTDVQIYRQYAQAYQLGYEQQRVDQTTMPAYTGPLPQQATSVR